MAHSNASLKALTLIFAGLYLAITITAALVVIALELFLQISLDSSFVGAVAPTVAAMYAGTIYFNRVGQRPEPRFSWMAGLSFSLTSILLGMVLFLAIYLAGVFPELAGMLRNPTFVAILAGFLAVLSLILLVICRFCFSFGAGQAEKAKQKAQARG